MKIYFLLIFKSRAQNLKARGEIYYHENVTSPGPIPFLSASMTIACTLVYSYTKGTIATPFRCAIFLNFGLSENDVSLLNEIKVFGSNL